ncbi:hypothetical protein L1987_19613 [Smallanthus sonchifolius]|uniref:Uncharacterized protein n=1 Tax=Smallanthus sonchifolius TaxID=185202 RepID=A0ACB9IP47_9ASTR|nr:hypothetical protein L1987_19613 [Smallanthus sonchifolius]
MLYLWHVYEVKLTVNVCAFVSFFWMWHFMTCFYASEILKTYANGLILLPDSALHKWPVKVEYHHSYCGIWLNIRAFLHLLVLENLWIAFQFY